MVKKQNCAIWLPTVSLYTKKQTDDIYKDIAEVVETRFDNSNYELLERRLPKANNKKVIELMKD